MVKCNVGFVHMRIWIELLNEMGIVLASLVVSMNNLKPHIYTHQILGGGTFFVWSLNPYFKGFNFVGQFDFVLGYNK